MHFLIFINDLNDFFSNVPLHEKFINKVLENKYFIIFLVCCLVELPPNDDKYFAYNNLILLNIVLFKKNISIYNYYF